MKVALHDKRTNEDGNLILVAVTAPRNSSSRWNREGQLLEKYTQRINSYVRDCLQSQGVQLTDVSERQIFDALVKIGYGDLHSVLTDGTTAKHQI